MSSTTSASGHPGGERCAKCGMLVDAAPRWIAGLTDTAGKERRFCSPRCMFSWWRGPDGKGSREAWVTEYYTQKRRRAGEVLFITESDVTGPMGKSLVPVAGRQAAERFLEDHHGARILEAREITRELLRELAGLAPPE